jgi:biopolymer transport protein TolQ
METATLDLAHSSNDLTIVYMFMQADIVVKSVMAILAFMSIWSWAIAIEKAIQLNGHHSRAKVFERDFWSGMGLEELADKYGKSANNLFGRVLVAALRDFDSFAVAKNAGAEANRELSKLESGLGVLAIIGSAAPFIGLFGTVWGIMNSFRAIAATDNTSLAVVAPGIAEALFATALGLLAAIPAVMFFNALSSNLGKLATKVEAFVDELAAMAGGGE